MKAKLVNEDIKHLTGKSEDEIHQSLQEYPLWQQFIIAKNGHIRITAKQHELMQKSIKEIMAKFAKVIRLQPDEYEFISPEEVNLNDNLIIFAHYTDMLEGFAGEVNYVDDKYIRLYNNERVSRYTKYFIWGIIRSKKPFKHDYAKEIYLYLWTNSKE